MTIDELIARAHEELARLRNIEESRMNVFGWSSEQMSKIYRGIDFMGAIIAALRQAKADAAEVPELINILRAKHEESTTRCPFCNRMPGEGHDNDCRLAEPTKEAKP